MGDTLYDSAVCEECPWLFDSARSLDPFRKDDELGVNEHAGEN